MQFKILPAFCLLLSFWFLLTNFNPNNPPTGQTGAPGETTCSTASGCHTGGTYVGTVTISGVPDTVVAGQSYTIILKNTSNAVRGGFELTSWDGANAMSGTLTAATGVTIGSGTAGKKYARQSTPKTLSGGSTSWTFTWKAPTTASGNKITFYFVSLCANGDGNKPGDNALKATQSVVLKSTSAAFEPNTLTALKFYPTLIQDNTLHVELLEAQKGQINLYDMNGRIVFQQSLSSVNDLDLKGLSKGAYTAQIIADGKMVAKKMVVE